MSDPSRSAEAGLTSVCRLAVSVVICGRPDLAGRNGMFNFCFRTSWKKMIFVDTGSLREDKKNVRLHRVESGTIRESNSLHGAFSCCHYRSDFVSSDDASSGVTPGMSSRIIPDSRNFVSGMIRRLIQECVKVAWN